MTLKKRLAFAESLVVWGFRRRYLKEMRAPGRPPAYDELAARALERLSIGGVHQLADLLKEEREILRRQGDNQAADSLTMALRDLDSRTQILDDLLH
jgi:hypothetical protein